jgi:hypothetical protein
MSEKKLSIEELLHRIDELLDILNIISRDLVEVSKVLKTFKVQATVPRRVQAIEAVQVLFPEDLKEMLEFEEMEKYIVIRPRGYLGSENFSKIASIIRDAGGEYISAGKESHFRIFKDVGSERKTGSDNAVYQSELGL